MGGLPRRDQATTPLSHIFTEQSKPGLVSQLEHCVLKLNRKGMVLLQKKKQQQIATKFTDASLSFEVYNLMGINNVLSHQWIQDVTGRMYSIPNYLTQRRFNLKLLLRF